MRSQAGHFSRQLCENVQAQVHIATSVWGHDPRFGMLYRGTCVSHVLETKWEQLTLQMMLTAVLPDITAAVSKVSAACTIGGNTDCPPCTLMSVNVFLTGCM